MLKFRQWREDIAILHTHQIRPDGRALPAESASFEIQPRCQNVVVRHDAYRELVILESPTDLLLEDNSFLHIWRHPGIQSLNDVWQPFLQRKGDNARPFT